MIPLKTLVRDAVRYWERKRLVYNGALAGIVLLALALDWPRSMSWFRPPASTAFLQAAIAANVLYCAAYFAEFVIHLTPLRANLAVCRKVVFIAGVLLASVFALMIVGIILIGPMSN